MGTDGLYTPADAQHPILKKRPLVVVVAIFKSLQIRWKEPIRSPNAVCFALDIFSSRGRFPSVPYDAPLLVLPDCRFLEHVYESVSLVRKNNFPTYYKPFMIPPCPPTHYCGAEREVHKFSNSR
jgi:hypothetical protein